MGRRKTEREKGCEERKRKKERGTTGSSQVSRVWGKEKVLGLQVTNLFSLLIKVLIIFYERLSSLSFTIL